MSDKLLPIFILIVATNVIINMDHGIIPAATLQIQEDLHVSNSQLGYLGSLVYLGIVMVGIMVGRLFLRISAKVILSGSYAAMIITLVLFTLNFNTTWPYFVLRFLTGCAQAPMLIYFPVWIDHFGADKKTMWLTILTGVTPLGIFLGYVLSSIISYYVGWQCSFYAQAALLAPCFALFSTLNVHKIDIKSNKHTVSDAEELALDLYQPNHWDLLKILFQQKIWICVTLTISIMYFVVTGIQFWMSNYMEVVMGQPQQKVNIMFAVISITAPVLGCLFGGFISHWYGGYDTPHNLKICLIYCVVGTMCSVGVPYVTNFWIVALQVWGLLFFGGALVPPLTGTMMVSVPSKLRTFAASNTTTIINLLGYLPAPAVYGQLTKVNENAGIIFLMTYPLVGVLLIALALYYQNKQKHQSVDHSKSNLINTTVDVEAV